MDVLDTLQRVVQDQRAALAALARREGLRPEDALDCVHDALCAFLELAQKSQLPAAPAEHGAFLAGMVINTARNLRRRHHLSRPHDAPTPADEADGAPTTETLLTSAEECVRLRGCMARLCDKQRTVVMMRLLEERDGKDVASELGISRAHVDVLLHRAKASLRVCMAHEPPAD